MIRKKELKITKENMKEEYVKDICKWKYLGKYSVYNMMPFKKLVESQNSILDKEKSKNYFCYLKKKEVVGYTRIYLVDEDTAYVGIRVKPKYCGRGYGEYLLRDTINTARKKYPKYKIGLEVRTFNKRAIRLYKRIGFIKVNQLNKKDNDGNIIKFNLMELIEDDR